MNSPTPTSPIAIAALIIAISAAVLALPAFVLSIINAVRIQKLYHAYHNDQQHKQTNHSQTQDQHTSNRPQEGLCCKVNCQKIQQIRAIVNKNDNETKDDEDWLLHLKEQQQAPKDAQEKEAQNESKPKLYETAGDGWTYKQT